MKKLFTFLLVLMIVISTNAPVQVLAEDTIVLSEMSVEECVAFLKANGVEIPEEHYSELEWGVFAKEIIAQVEENPGLIFAFGYSALLNFAESIKSVVIKHYSMDGNNYAMRTMAVTSLQDNTVYGSWSDDYLNYNCYAYALGLYDRARDPGMFSNNSISMDTSISGIAESVRTDLQALGYTVLTVSSAMPTVTVSDHTHLICVRKDVDGIYLISGGMLILLKDYHFMKLEQDGNWYHKPGRTNPLRYKYVPSNERIWVAESYDGSTYDRQEGWTYDSDIYFIAYTTPHTYAYEMCGNGQHTRTCTICDYEETLSCDYTYTYLYDDTHNASCKYCNNSYYGVVCTFSYSSNADETHTRVCDVCGNTQTTSCNLQYSNINNTRHSVSCAECDYYVASQLCSVAYTSNGNKTHTGSCVKCENTFSGSCSIAYSYLSADQHRGSCNKCDYAHTAACDYMTTYCGNSAAGDVHKRQCQICGHGSDSAATACSFIFKGNGNNTHSQMCTQCLYVKSGPDPCLFKTGDTCHFCGALKDSAVINQLEQEELPE